MRGLARDRFHQKQRLFLEWTATVIAPVLILVLLSPLAHASEFESGYEKPSDVEQRSTHGYDLLAFVRANSIPDEMDEQEGISRYDRQKHFGGWQTQDPNNRCSRTREVVLIRQSDPRRPAQSNSSCRVVKGLWLDPYTGAQVSDPSYLQIDHVVPLRHAYYAGAHSWSGAERCHYANFVYNTFHLIAVDSHENMSKGARAPDTYMPPNERFHCEYLNDWLKIKIIWRLWSSTAEVNAIERRFAEANCPNWLRYISADELSNQRIVSQQPIESCRRFEAESRSHEEPIQVQEHAQNSLAN